jgi:RNA polymerase sigma-70 factor (ECF subfamily)
MSTLENEQELIVKAVSGDRLALGDLLLAHSSRLSRHLAPMLPASVQGKLSVDDILQQTFVRAFCGIGQLRQATSRSFSTWLTRIAENQLRNALADLQRQKRGGQQRQVRGPVESQSSSMVELVELLSGRDQTASHVIARREAVHALAISIAALPEDQRHAVRHHLIEGRSLAETAVAMHRTPGAVSALVHRAKQNLRKAMGRASQWLSKK